MTLGMDLGEYLHPVEVELLCAFAEVAAPFPLEIPSTGETDVERLVMFRGAREMLTERGLADDSGPLGLADDFVYLLGNATGVLDLVLATEKPTLAAVVMCYRDEALLVTQDLEGPDHMIRMKAATLDDAVEIMVGLVPALAASATAPFSLPRHAVESALNAMLKRDEEPLRPEEIDELLTAHGMDERLVRRMVTHLQPVLGSGQSGVAKRDQTEDQWHRVGEELRWVDTQKGRLRLAEDGEWISVNPLSAEEIRAGLRKLGAAIRG